MNIASVRCNTFGPHTTVHARAENEALGIHPGSYTIEVRWLGSVLNASPFRHEYRSLEPAVIQFELRDTLSAFDLLDRDLHLAVRALTDNEPFRS